MSDPQCFHALLKFWRSFASSQTACSNGRTAWSPVRTSLEWINLGIWGTASAVWFVGYSHPGTDYVGHIQSLVGEGSL